MWNYANQFFSILEITKMSNMVAGSSLNALQSFPLFYF